MRIGFLGPKGFKWVIRKVGHGTQGTLSKSRAPAPQHSLPLATYWLQTPHGRDICLAESWTMALRRNKVTSVRRNKHTHTHWGQNRPTFASLQKPLCNMSKLPRGVLLPGFATKKNTNIQHVGRDQTEPGRRFTRKNLHIFVRRRPDSVRPNLWPWAPSCSLCSLCLFVCFVNVLWVVVVFVF